MSLALCTLQHDAPLPNSAEATPVWVPGHVRAYLAHVCQGVPIRALARDSGCHASTIMRQIRKVEAARDDLLTDEALDRLSSNFTSTDYASPTEYCEMSAAHKIDIESEAQIEREARRILRRLCESKAFLLVSPQMDKSAVFREAVPGRRTRTAVVERSIAQAFALKDWITGEARGKVAQYTITQAGRAALKRLLAEDQKTKAQANGFAEVQSPFQAQHRHFGEREIMERDGRKTVRYNLAESPLTSLGRKKDKDGVPYLTSNLLEAGERLREDFEIAQMGPRVAQNWDNFLTASCDGSYSGSRGPAEGPQAARDRVAAALAAMGPGLADVAFRCCCFLEGLETAEKRLGWSARSGKVVLKISLQRLADYYMTLQDSRMIG